MALENLTENYWDYLANDITKSISDIKDRMDPNISKPVNEIISFASC